MENPESTLDLETSLQLKVSRLEKEVEDQKRTIAELTGTDNVHIDTNDVTVLYHLQLRENQSLRAEIERLQQLLSEVNDCYRLDFQKKGQEAAFETIHTDVLNPLHSIVEGTEECHNLISILVLILCVAHEQETNYQSLQERYQKQSEDYQQLCRYEEEKVKELSVKLKDETSRCIESESERKRLNETVVFKYYIFCLVVFGSKRICKSIK